MKRFLAILVSVMMIAAMALPVMASTPFSDVPGNHWALDAVKLLAALGIVEGYPDGTFRGKNTATRYEVAIMIARALEYLDKDIRSLAETVGELEAKIGAPQASSKQPADKTQVVLQPVASPDATILEQVIAEKIAGMSEAQWEQFDDRLSALLARVDDLTVENKAEHAQLWAAIEALRTKPVVTATVTPTTVEVASSCAAVPGCEKAIAEAIAKSEATWQAALAKLTTKVSGLEANDGNFEARLEALRRAIYTEGTAVEAENEAISRDLAAKLEELSLSSKTASDEAVKVLLAVHAAEERAARDAALAELESKIELALLQQKAELMMAFYDSVIASNDERDRHLAALKADFERALADREAAILQTAGQRNQAALQLAIDENNALLIAAMRESLDAYRDEVDRKFDNTGAQTDVRFAALEAAFEQALLEQNAELMMAFYNSISATKDEFETRLEKALTAQKAEILAAHAASVNEMKAAYDARLNDMEATWQIALLEQKAELMMAFYDSIAAEADSRTRALEAMAEKHDIDLAQLRAELQMSFYDSIAAESDARARALEALAEKHDIDLLQLKAEMQMGYYDSMIALREDLEGRIDVVIASIAALKDEYGKELKALGARVSNLEAQLALVQAQVDKNTRDIAANYTKIMTEEIAPINQRVGKLERETTAAKADIAALRVDVDRVRITGSNETKFIDVNGFAEVGGQLYKNPFNRVAVTSTNVYLPGSTLQNELMLTLNIQPDPGVKVTANIGVLTDVFGIKDASGVLPKVDVDMSIVTPSGATSIVAGELVRPANFTKYQASAKVWSDKAIEGISVAHTAGTLNLNGFTAKVGHDSSDSSATEYMHIAGAAGRLALTPNFSVGVRGMVKGHDETSGDLTALGNPDETVAGADFALTLNRNLKLAGELSAWKDDPTEPFLYAKNISANAKLGALNIGASFAEVDEGYAPFYLGTSSSDADRVKQDSRLAKLTVATDPIKGLVLSGLAQRSGDALYNSADVMTLGGAATYTAKVVGADLILRGDAEHSIDAFDVDWQRDTVANLGFDLNYRPLSAGFTWKNEFIDADPVAMSYIGYAKLNMPLAGDTLTVRGGWEQSFGAEQWYIWGAGLKMAMPLIEKRLTLAANAGYDVTHDVPGFHPAYNAELNDLARLTMGADLNFQVTAATSLTGGASYESRQYEAATAPDSVSPSGEYLQFGAGLNHQFYKSTSLTLKYDIKKVLYAAGGPQDYGVRIINLSLKTVF